MVRRRSTRWGRWHVRTLAPVMATVLLSVGGIQPSHAAGGSELWVARSPGAAYSSASRVGGLATSPDGSRVFVTGIISETTRFTLRTVAYDAATGAELWSDDYKGQVWYSKRATAISVSPKGSTVFVMASGYVAHEGLDYLTLAYDGATAARVWKRTYSSPLGYSHDESGALGVSPDGSTVFVTGASSDGFWSDYATVAYRASNGHHLWSARYGRDSKDAGRAVSVSPDGSAVFVSGYSVSSTSLDIETIGYNAVTGRELWKTRYDGHKHHEDQANAMAVSPDGSSVYVTGFSDGSSRNRRHFVTLAYGAKTGKQRWVRRYNGPGIFNDNAKAISTSPDGTRVYVAGYRSGHEGRDAETIAYSSAGGRLWLRAYNGPADGLDQATAIGVSPDGKTIFITGYRYDLPYNSEYLTLAYRASTGDTLWGAFYDHDEDGASALGVKPDGSAVYVSGLSGADFTTVAYSTS